jgi:hypothetical protein
VHLRQHTEREPLASRRPERVQDELREQGAGVQRPVREPRPTLTHDREHQRRADGVPRDHQPHRDPAHAQRTAHALLEAPHDDPARDRQRHEADGEHEQHRHEDQLRRDGRSGADLEVQPEDGPVRGDQEERGDPAGMPVRRHQQGQRDRGGEKSAREDDDRGQLAACQTVQPARALFLDDALLLGIEKERAGCRGRRSGHAKQIDPPAAALEANARTRSLVRGIPTP